MKILIGIVTLLALSAVLGAIIIGSRTFEGTVVDKPYDRGLMWDQEQEARQESGLSVKIMDRTFKTGRNNLVISVSDRQLLPVADAMLRVTVSRPATNQYNRTYDLQGAGNGIYSAPVELPLYGYWDVDITVVRKGQSILLREKIFAEK